MKIRTNADVQRLGTIVSIWAHPDDETFACGGLLAIARQNGQRVICVTATRGEAGVQDHERWPADQLAGIRQAELEAALDVLGVHEHHWLQYADGHCAEAPPEEVHASLQDILQSVQADTFI